MAVLTHIDRVPFGAPTPEEIAHDKIAKQHFWWKVYGTRTKAVTHWMPLPDPPKEEHT